MIPKRRARHGQICQEIRARDRTSEGQHPTTATAGEEAGQVEFFARDGERQVQSKRRQRDLVAIWWSEPQMPIRRPLARLQGLLPRRWVKVVVRLPRNLA
eukprot:scaffold4079_cov250-Pinguiococcus_pyrenoidosus.AAC.3